MKDYPSSVVDEDGNVHTLIPTPIGQGGQGVVFRTRNPHIAIKLINAASPPVGALPRERASHRLWSHLTVFHGLGAIDDEKRLALRRRLEDVRLLPLPELQVALPLSMLRDQVGYSMRLLKEMVPIRTLIAEPGTENLAGFFQATGGVRRRLSVLTHLANVLARIHAVPLVYADVSPNNVFVSDDIDASEVWLIDLDNLDHQSEKSSAIHTPGFGAPEVVTGRGGVTTLSDAYSFSILAFYVLTQVHPFFGDYVEADGWDSDEDREEMALRGLLPWIEDPADTMNRTAHGIPRELVLSKPIRELFQRAFGPGRKDRAVRPSMAEWVEVLRKSVDRVVSCKSCGSSFEVARKCGFCGGGAAPEFIHMQVHRWDPDLDPDEKSALGSRPVWHKMIDATGDVVLKHVVEPTLADAKDPPVLRIRSVPRGMSIELMNSVEVHVVLAGRIQRVEREITLPTPKPGSEVYLHFGSLERSHRMAVLRHHAGSS